MVRNFVLVVLGVCLPCQQHDNSHQQVPEHRGHYSAGWGSMAALGLWVRSIARKGLTVEGGSVVVGRSGIGGHRAECISVGPSRRFRILVACPGDDGDGRLLVYEIGQWGRRKRKGGESTRNKR